jgi:hypothetical protein
MLRLRRIQAAPNTTPIYTHSAGCADVPDEVSDPLELALVPGFLLSCHAAASGAINFTLAKYAA